MLDQTSEQSGDYYAMSCIFINGYN
uniref:Uncharacterized protein n=1 Tax=Tetranychus urticae TaxID=32264 RepID=T1KQ81_TETUR